MLKKFFILRKIDTLEVNTVGFLEKLNYLMERDNLNKSTLSKACNIPYTTIDGWYKKGYEGLKLTTLRKLAKFFGTSLDYWASEQTFDEVVVNNEVKELARQYGMLSKKDRELVKSMINSLSEKVETDRGKLD